MDKMAKICLLSLLILKLTFALQCNMKSLCDNTEPLAVFMESNKISCSLECRKNNDCYWFTLDLFTGTCFIYNNCPESIFNQLLLLQMGIVLL